MAVWLKFCGLTREADIQIASECDPDALGIVMEPRSPRFVHPDRAFDLVRHIPRGTMSVAVFGEFHYNEAVPKFDAVQCFGARPEELDENQIWIAARRPEPGSSVSDLLCGLDGADFVVLDAYSPSAAGGTGETVSGEVFLEFQSEVGRPCVLAGGLNPTNVAEIIENLGPFGVDVSTGIEASRGVKDPELMRAFAHAAQKKVRER